MLSLYEMSSQLNNEIKNKSFMSEDILNNKILDFRHSLNSLISNNLNKYVEEHNLADLNMITNFLDIKQTTLNSWLYDQAIPSINNLCKIINLVNKNLYLNLYNEENKLVMQKLLCVPNSENNTETVKKMINTSMANLLYEFRLILRFTPRDFADFLGMTHTAIYYYEGQKESFSFNVLGRLCYKMGLTPKFVLGNSLED